MRSQVFPANLLQCGLLFPLGHKSCQGTCSSAGFTQVHSLIWASAHSGVWFSVGCRWISPPVWCSMGCRAPWIAPRAAGEPLLRHLEDLPSLLNRPWCLQSCCSHIFSLLSPPANAVEIEMHQLLPFLKSITPEALSTLLMVLALASSRSSFKVSQLDYIFQTYFKEKILLSQSNF